MPVSGAMVVVGGEVVVRPHRHPIQAGYAEPRHGCPGQGLADSIQEMGGLDADCDRDASE